MIVDPEDEWLLAEKRWRISTKGYIECTTYWPDGSRRTEKLHHYIMGTPIWENEFIDHINRDKQDCRKENMRWVDGYTNRQNSDYVENAKNIRVAKDGKFEVRIQRNGVLEQVGTFATMEEAVYARDKWHASYAITRSRSPDTQHT